MKLGKIALWVLITFLLSAMIFGTGIVNELYNSEWTFDGPSFFSNLNQPLDVTESVSADQISKIEVLSNSPNIQVVTKVSNQITARLHGTLHLTKDESVPQLVITRTDNNISIEVKSKSNNSYGLLSSNLEMEITIPDRYNNILSVSSASGSVRIEEIELETLIVQSSSGNIHLIDVSTERKLQAVSTSGSISSENIDAGDLFSINTSSGNIDLINIAAEEEFLVTSTSGSVLTTGIEAGNLVSINSTSGNIHADMISNAKELKIGSTSGNIKLSLADSDNIEINSKTTSGTIQCNILLDDEKHHDNSLTGKQGNGKNKVKLTATSGSIQIM